MDLTKGFRFYSRFKYVRYFKFCVNALVERYPVRLDDYIISKGERVFNQ